MARIDLEGGSVQLRDVLGDPVDHLYRAVVVLDPVDHLLVPQPALAQV
jgi:hypothetical protein